MRGLGYLDQSAYSRSFTPFHYVIVVMNPPKTFIIGGNFRGGTTAVAQLLARLGIYLGEDLASHGNHEDLAFQRLLTEPELNADELAKLTHKRNQSHPIWGFKFPGAHTFMPDMLSCFRNPRLIFVFRDPIAVADCENRRSGQNHIQMMQRTAQFNAHMVELMTQLPDRTHGISYEMLRARTSKVVDQLVDFLELEVAADLKQVLVESIKPFKDPHSVGYSPTRLGRRVRMYLRQKSRMFLS